MKRIGYLRVSTDDQKPDRQIDGLKPLCDVLHVERVSAIAKRRPIFERVMRQLNSGDALVVWDLDRAFRSTFDALRYTEILRDRGVEFQIVTLGVDTTTASGKFVFTVIAANAELERNRLSERTKEGLRAAVKRGKKLGRRPKLSRAQVLDAQQKIALGEATIKEIAALNGVHPDTVTRAINRFKTDQRN